MKTLFFIIASVLIGVPTEGQTAENNREIPCPEALKALQVQYRDLQNNADGYQRNSDTLAEQCAVAERRANLFQGEIKELRKAREQAERVSKQAETELNEAMERKSLLHTQNTDLINQKRDIEQKLESARGEIDEAISGLRIAEEKAKKANSDADKMAAELKKEQGQSAHLERMKKNMEVTIMDLQLRLDESKQAAMKGGKKQIQKLHQRVRELENELEVEQRRTADAQKYQKKLERELRNLLKTVPKPKNKKKL